MSKEIAVQPKQVLDLETDKWIDIEPEKQRQARNLVDVVQKSVFVTAMALKEIWDKKLYLHLGYTSKQEFVFNELPFSMRQARRYVAIGNKWAPFALENTTPVSHSEGENRTPVSDLEGMGIKRLYELARLEDDDFKALAEGGTIQTENGPVDIEAIKEMGQKEFMGTLGDIKKKYSGKLAQAQEDLALLKAEQKDGRKRLDELESRLANAEELEKLYGSKANKLEDKKKTLQLCIEYFDRARELAFKIEPTVDDPETFLEDFADLFQKADAFNKDLRARHTEVADKIQDLEL